jgi:8-oxo-dGTP pyrophosphatase MutT (NUDIX family)
MTTDITQEYKKEKQAGCAGVIVFNENQVAMVKTPAGHWGYPKGKVEKVKDANDSKKKARLETTKENALRELEQETGLKEQDIEFITEEHIDEYNDRGNLSIRYLVAKLKKDKHTFKYDPEELDEVKWVDVDDALKLDSLKDSRKEVLKKAINYIKK